MGNNTSRPPPRYPPDYVKDFKKREFRSVKYDDDALYDDRRHEASRPRHLHGPGFPQAQEQNFMMRASAPISAPLIHVRSACPTRL